MSDERMPDEPTPAELEETHRMQLLAISDATFHNTQESFSESEIKPDHPYYTVAYLDVRCAIIREMRERERALALEQSLKDVLGLIEDGWLVRDTTHDAEPGWAVRQLPRVQQLGKASALLAARSPEKEER